MTSGEEERTALCNSRRASRSPPSALAESSRSSARCFLASDDSSGSALMLKPPSPFVTMAAGGDQVRLCQSLHRLLELTQKGSVSFETLPLRFPVGSLFFPVDTLKLVELGDQLRQGTSTNV